jgi:hypothetical protein
VSCAHERFEDALEMLRRDAVAGVADRDRASAFRDTATRGLRIVLTSSPHRSRTLAWWSIALLPSLIAACVGHSVIIRSLTIVVIGVSLRLGSLLRNRLRPQAAAVRVPRSVHAVATSASGWISFHCVSPAQPWDARHPL